MSACVNLALTLSISDHGRASRQVQVPIGTVPLPAYMHAFSARGHDSIAPQMLYRRALQSRILVLFPVPLAVPAIDLATHARDRGERGQNVLINHTDPANAFVFRRDPRHVGGRLVVAG
jgi:hypothetical protein